MAAAMGLPARGRLFPTLAVDLATGRLLKACQAIADGQLEERDVALALVRRAKAVRSFVEAGEPGMANAVMIEMCKVELSRADCTRVLTDRVKAVTGAIKAG